jgi:hypothetical protein
MGSRGAVIETRLESRPPSERLAGTRPAPSADLEHTEISGRVLRFSLPPSPEVLSFLRRVRAMVDMPNGSAASVRALVFGPENPLLARHPTLPGAYPDASTVRQPAYWVCVDLVLRAEAREAGVSLEEAGRPFTTTMAEAARKLNRVQSAIVNAVENRTLHTWVHGGRRYLLPAEVAAYSVPRRGRLPKNKRE